MKNKSLLFLIVLTAFLIGCGGDEKPRKAKTNPANKTTQVEEPSKKSEESNDEADEEVSKTIVPPEEIAKAKEIIAAVSSDEISGVDAEGKYKAFCAACHGFDGKLKVNGAKDLSKSTLPLEESVAQVYHGRGLMTPFKGIMKDAEIVAVAQYIEKNLRK